MRASDIEFQMELRGQQVIIFDIQWESAEPDIGIMTPYLGGWNIKDLQGNILEWDMDDEKEITAITEKIYEMDREESSREEYDYGTDYPE